MAATARQIVKGTEANPGSASSTTYALTFGPVLATSSLSLLLCYSAGSQQNPTLIADTSLNSGWSSKQHRYDSSGNATGLILLSVDNVAAAAVSNTVTVTFPTSVTYRSAVGFEISGTGGYLDSAINLQAGSVTGTDAITSTAKTIGAAGILLAVGFNDGDTLIPTAGTGFTDDGTHFIWEFSGFARFQHKAVTAGSVAGTFTQSGTNGNNSYLTGMMAFSDAGAAQPQVIPRQRMPFEQVREELVRRRFTPLPSGIVIADNPPLMLRRTSLEPPPVEQRVQVLRVTPPAVDDPMLGVWADRGETSKIEEPLRRLRVPLPSGAAAPDAPPLRLRGAPAEPVREEPLRRLRVTPDAVDAPPLDLRRMAPDERQLEEPIRRLRVTPDAVDAPPLRVRQPVLELAPEERLQRRMRTLDSAVAPAGDAPPLRLRARAEERQTEEPLQRFRVTPPTGAAPVGDQPPFPKRKRPEEARAETPVARRLLAPTEPAVVADAPPLRLGRQPHESVPYEAPARPRAVPPGSAVDLPPAARQWVRYEVATEAPLPRRYLVFAPPADTDAPPIRIRGAVVEPVREEPLRRLRVTPDNAPIVPGDLPVFRVYQPVREFLPEELPQRRQLSAAVAGAIVVFHPRYVGSVRPRANTVKVPPR